MDSRSTCRLIEITADQIDASREFLTLQRKFRKEVPEGSADDARLQAADYMLRSVSTMLRTLTLPDEDISARLGELLTTEALKWPEETEPA